MSADILVPALAGYLFLRYTHVTWFEVLRESGHHLVFRSALWGLGFYVVGWIVAGELGVPDFLEPPEKDPRREFNLSPAGWWTLVLAGIAVVVCNVSYGRERAERRAAERSEDTLVRLVDEAIRAEETIELSLRDGKTYIGYVTKGPIRKYGGEADAVVVLPVLSGYRKQETRELVLTTEYADAVRTVRDPRRLQVAIPRSEISRARLFDIKLYKQADFRLLVDEEPARG